MEVIFVGGPEDGKRQSKDLIYGDYISVIRGKYSCKACYAWESPLTTRVRYTQVFDLGNTKVYAMEGVTLEMVVARLLEKYIIKEA